MTDMEDIVNDLKKVDEYLDSKNKAQDMVNVNGKDVVIVRSPKNVPWIPHNNVVQNQH